MPDKIARWAAFASLPIAVVSAAVAFLGYQETTKTNRLSSWLEARELLSSALDMMGGVPGTERFLLPGGAPDAETRRVLELARRKLDRALELSPDFYLAHEYYGLYLHLTGDLEEALRFHERAVELTEDDGWPYAAYANTLRSLGREADAVAALSSVIELNPRNPHFHRNLGLVLWDLGRREDAEASFSNARRLATLRGIALTFPNDE